MQKLVFFFCILIARCLKCTYTLCAYMLQWCYCRFTISPSNVFVFLLDDGRFLLFIGTFFDRHNIFFYYYFVIHTAWTQGSFSMLNKTGTSTESPILCPLSVGRLQNDMTHSIHSTIIQRFSLDYILQKSFLRFYFYFWRIFISIYIVPISYFVRSQSPCFFFLSFCCRSFFIAATAI